MRFPRVEIQQVETWGCPTCGAKVIVVNNLLQPDEDGLLTCPECDQKVRWTY